MVPPELNETALRLARATFDDLAGVGVLSLIREGPRSRVYRLSLDPGSSPETAILKQITDGGECGFTDWASLQLLSRVPGGAGIAPRYLAGDVEARCFLMEDLGPSRTLDDPLQGSDAAASITALEALARTYARLHALPADEGEWRRLRGSLPAGERLGRAAEAERWLQGHTRLQAWADALGMSTLQIDHTQMQPVVQSYAEPGPFLAFTHGDPAPTNNHLSPEAVRLVDFEYGGFRHALYDLTAWYILCPLPEPVVVRMITAYREELARRGSPMVDAPFDAGWAEMCVYRALAMLTWISPTVLEANGAWVGAWTAREAVLAAVGRMFTAASPHPHLGPFAEFVGAMLARLEARWPEYRNPYVRFPGLAGARILTLAME